MNVALNSLWAVNLICGPECWETLPFIICIIKKISVFQIRKTWHRIDAKKVWQGFFAFEIQIFRKTKHRIDDIKKVWQGFFAFEIRIFKRNNVGKRYMKWILRTCWIYLLPVNPVSVAEVILFSLKLSKADSRQGSKNNRFHLDLSAILVGVSVKFLLWNPTRILMQLRAMNVCFLYVRCRSVWRVCAWVSLTKVVSTESGC